jgi:type IV pilus assembly protein PilN
LIEIRAAGLGQGRNAKNVFDFTINVGIKRPRDQEQQQQAAGTAGKAAAQAAPKAP